MNNIKPIEVGRLLGMRIYGEPLYYEFPEYHVRHEQLGKCPMPYDGPRVRSIRQVLMHKLFLFLRFKVIQPLFEIKRDGR